MKTLNTTLIPTKLTRIDEAVRLDHDCISESDNCYYLGEYIVNRLTSNQPWKHSKVNNWIYNFKKPMERKDKPDFIYKKTVMIEASRLLAPHFVKNCEKMTFVPIPPSKTQDDPLYDDRVFKVLDLINKGSDGKLDIRRLITQKQSLSADHEATLTGTARKSIEELRSNYVFIDSLAADIKPIICIFDDVLTTVRHYRAMSDLLTEKFPDRRIIGVFLARTVHIDSSETLPTDDSI